MKISVRIKPGSRKENNIERLDDTNYIAHVREQPVNGKANDALVRLLSDYFGVPQNHIKIVKGVTSKFKLVEIENRPS